MFGRRAALECPSVSHSPNAKELPVQMRIMPCYFPLQMEGEVPPPESPTRRRNTLVSARLVDLRWVALLAFVAVTFTFALPTVAQTVRVDSTPSHSTNSIKPTEALGAAIDRLPYGAVDKLFNDDMVKQVLASGWQTVSYRQNTELHIEAWHWNPQGTWSDPSGQRLLYRQRNARPAAAALLRLSASPPRRDP